jgi:PII-like signaling protein
MFKDWIKETFGKIGLATLKRNSPIVKEVVDNRENVKLELYIEGDEIIFKLKKKGS